MIRLLVFFHLLKLFHFKMPICHFQSMGMGWMWGGGYGSGPVFLISVMSYHYMIFRRHLLSPSLSFCTACSNAGPKPGCAGACDPWSVCMHCNPPCLSSRHGNHTYYKCDSQSYRYIVHAILHGMGTTLQMWFPVLIHMFICTYMHYICTTNNLLLFGRSGISTDQPNPLQRSLFRATRTRPQTDLQPLGQWLHYASPQTD